MKLQDWLEQEGIEARVFARRISRSPEAVRRYLSGERIPDKDTMPLIVCATGTAVTPNDFFGIPAQTAEAAAA